MGNQLVAPVRDDRFRWRPKERHHSLSPGHASLLYAVTSSSNFSTGAAMNQLQWGGSGDVPLQQDFDGDGKSDVVVFRGSTGHRLVKKSSTTFTRDITYQWGTSGDIPVPADYDGDGMADLAVYRPPKGTPNGTWHIRTSGSGYTDGYSYVWGEPGDMPMAVHRDGDGKADLGIFRPSTGDWFILKSSSGYTTQDPPSMWGEPGDLPIPGDYDGDAITDAAVYRPSNSTWYVLRSSGGSGRRPLRRRDR